MKKRYIALGIVGIILIVMTISDIYFSNLNEHYHLVNKSDYVKGNITGYRSHWRYVYVEIDNREKFLIRPTKSLDSLQFFLNDVIALNQSIMVSGEEGKITIDNNNQKFSFLIH